jgi:hypothetical protein
MEDEAIPERYEQNPMLALVENYVLDVLGVLPEEKAELLGAIVCRTFGGTDWREVIRKQFHLPKEGDEQLKLLWKQRQEEAETRQEDMTVEDFAREQADEVFRAMGD